MHLMKAWYLVSLNFIVLSKNIVNVEMYSEWCGRIQNVAIM